MQSDAARRQQLEGYIANSRRVRRRAIRLGIALLALALVLRLAGAGPAAFFTVALVAAVIGGAGAWITWGHVQDFEKELRRLGTRARR
jgi:hypothetical protein